MNDAPRPDPAHAALEVAAAAQGRARHVLRLYVAGVSSLSMRTIVSLRRLCEEHLPGRHDLEVVDLTREPGRAKDDGIIATPTLVRQEPLPVRRFVGDFSQTERILRGLDLLPASPFPR